jgi:hypothetical protein
MRSVDVYNEDQVSSVPEEPLPVGFNAYILAFWRSLGTSASDSKG